MRGPRQDGETSIGRWEFRRAVADDLPRLASLEAACFREAWDEAFLASWLDPARGACWVIAPPPPAGEPQGAIAGYALFQVLPGPEAELLRVAIAPGLRGRGLARRLLEICLAELAAAGPPVCFLEVRASNRAAISLYERLGFRLSGRRPRYYADGEDALLFRLSGPRRTG